MPMMTSVDNSLTATSTGTSGAKQRCCNLILGLYIVLYSSDQAPQSSSTEFQKLVVLLLCGLWLSQGALSLDAEAIK